MTIQEIIQEIKENKNMDWTKDFVEEGIFDSLDIMTLVERLEENFGCSIERTEIVPENFVSINAIENMVIRNGGVLK